MINQIRKIVSMMVTIVIIGLVCIFVAPKIFGFNPTAVLSGSMEPQYPVGPLIFVHNTAPQDIKKNDIITFSMGDGNTAVTHRVIDVNADGTFTTKGDANNVEDGTAVTEQRIIGKASNFAIPLLGYITVYMNTPIGYMVIGAIILVLVLVSFIGDKPTKKGEKENEKS